MAAMMPTIFPTSTGAGALPSVAAAVVVPGVGAVAVGGGAEFDAFAFERFTFGAEKLSREGTAAHSGGVGF